MKSHVLTVSRQKRYRPTYLQMKQLHDSSEEAGMTSMPTFRAAHARGTQEHGEGLGEGLAGREP